ncbi:PAS domain-containing protein [Hymenobacter sp. YC55]|uniref:PAS domain-containing protein n=1 Tax=Hymenobacter sp. YC55 TaxID=3034019 RepID=UPI0023F7F1A6|nr:PAS domain-containing protein [Hymenobacter sp. YC55]MDF7814793.1 PAS domain-containing protein [Hymenobacter sp. YC55]
MSSSLASTDSVLASVFAAFAPADELLRDILAVSLTGIIFYTPVYGAGGEIVDFTFVYLNATAQRMMNMPAQPTLTHRQQWPHSEEHGTFAFHVDAFVSGEPRHFNVNYQADGHDNYYRLAARRSGEGLLVSFTDTADHPRSAVEIALRESQARTQQELLEAAERRTQEQERFYQVFEQTPACIGLLRGPEHTFEYVNPAYQQLFPGRQLVGRPLAEVLPEALNHGFVDLLNRVYQTGETFYGNELPLRLEQPDGQPPKQMYFTFTYQAYRENGTIAGISIFAYDVSEQVQAQQQAVWQEQLLYTLFLEAPAAICILDGPDFIYELVNPGYQALFPERQLLGRPLLEALPEIEHNPVYQSFLEVYNTGQTHEERGMLIPFVNPADGKLEDRYFNYIQQARRNEQGHVDGVLVFAFEVTEQVRARQSAEASTRQLRLLTDALPVLIGYVDQEQKYRFANRAYGAWFQQDPADLLGQQVREVIGEQAYVTVQPYLERALSGEQVDFETMMRYSPNLTKRIHTIYVPDVQEGRVMGCFSLITDVTEQVLAHERVQHLNQELAAINEELRATNEELGETNQQLVHTNSDLDTFVYMASHDLRAPISNIEGLVQALREEVPTSVQQQQDVAYVFDLLQNTVVRFQHTIDQLTDVAKLQQAHAEPAELLDLPALAEAVRLDLLPTIQATEGELSLQLPPYLTVRFSPKNLRSILYNLLSNAFKYHSPDRPPRVQVRGRRADKSIVLEVHDNGLGLSEQQQSKLFQLYQRLHSHVDGSGVGLYMIKRIVNNAGGIISVQSQLGVGSIFTVTLPDIS